MFGTMKPHVPKILVSLLFALFAVSPTVALAQDGGQARGHVKKKGVDLDLRSLGKQVGDEVKQVGTLASSGDSSPVPGGSIVSNKKNRRGNVQVNDPGLDNIQIFPGFRPFVKFTQSETSVATFRDNIVATYNSSANQPIVQVGSSLFYKHRFLSAFSTSNDRGKTWTSGFFPPVPGSVFTFGDPSADVDRHGNFYFAGLGTDASSRSTVQVNKSTDGGRTWSDAVVVQQDDGSDKEWLAVGPDPAHHNRDNVYVTWTSFQTDGSAQLRLGRSTDGGATWTTRTIFAPAADPDPTHPQNALQFSNPYVDEITGRLYVPFLHFSNSDQDFIRILISDDAGDTFHFATFNMSLIDPTLLPVTQPGELTDCRSGGFRLAIHAGPDAGGRFGLRSFVQSSRMVLQPAFAARNGVLYLAWPNSTSTVFGDPSAGSNVLFMRSDDGGLTWSSPINVNPAVATNFHHVLPSLAIHNGPNAIHVSYYTQHTDGTVDVDMANSHDRGNSFPSNRNVRVTSTPFDLAPTNITLTATTSTNYDRTIQPCYCLGEYQSVKSANGKAYVLWGDGRNTVTEPVNILDPLSGQTHAQEDVFFQIVKAQ
jgi:hypothetical protein